ncbi:MAG: prepilin peptidase [Rhodospirillales bacterium]|nr:prepilin peptidase [Rhodospirillales bacterium]
MSILLACAAFALLVFAGLHDLAVRTVPNYAAVLLVLIGTTLRILDHNLLPALLYALVMFLFLAAIWVAGLMGGGDVKLWAASVLLIPPTISIESAFLVDVLLLGGALAILYLLLSLAVRKPAASRAGSHFQRFVRVERWRIKRRAPLPYACAIAGGTFAVLLPQILKS